MVTKENERREIYKMALKSSTCVLFPYQCIFHIAFRVFLNKTKAFIYLIKSVSFVTVFSNTLLLIRLIHNLVPAYLSEFCYTLKLFLYIGLPFPWIHVWLYGFCAIITQLPLECSYSASLSYLNIIFFVPFSEDESTEYCLKKTLLPPAFSMTLLKILSLLPPVYNLIFCWLLLLVAPSF